MSKPSSGHFHGTRGTRPQSVIRTYSKERVKSWAKKLLVSLPNSAKKKINTACVAYDETTGKYYYGHNGGMNRADFIKNPLLFGEDGHSGLLPSKKISKYEVGNCAEVDAVNSALNAGSKLSNLHITTIHTTKTQFGNYKEACENCTYSFKGKVKENYSGWKGDK